MSSLPASLTKIQSKVTVKKWKHHFYHRSWVRNSKITGQYRRNLNSSEILCLFLSPVSLMTIEFIVSEKIWRHQFPHSKSQKRSWANDSVVKSPIQLKFELIRDCMPVLVTFKFDKDPIKGD